MDCARHFIKRVLNPHFLSQSASYDVASTIHQNPRFLNQTASFDVASSIRESPRFVS